MASKQDNLEIKKRLMFSKDDDYYFITYNVLIFLNTIGCRRPTSKFTDYTKLVYITPFVSDASLVRLLPESKKLDEAEIDVLQEHYLKSRIRITLFTSILIAMEHKGLVGLAKNKPRKSIDVWINPDNIPRNFDENSAFRIEETNSRLLKQYIPRITTVTPATLLERLFSSKGVKVWG